MSLVLKRKRRDRVLIGDLIITVLSISPTAVRLAFDGPKSISILRGEVAARDPQQDVVEPDRSRRIDGTADAIGEQRT